MLSWLRDLDARLPERADVLELGCGRGVPGTRELARRHRVTGIDISAVQIELARHHVPEAGFFPPPATPLLVAGGARDAGGALFFFSPAPLHLKRAPLPPSVPPLPARGCLLSTF